MSACEIGSATAEDPIPGGRGILKKLVGWRHRIAALMVTVLAGLPVSGTVCAMVCDSANTKALSHHGAGKNCEDSTPASTGAQVRGVSEHDCSTHDAAVLQLITTTAPRGDAVAFTTPLAVAIVHAVIETPSNSDPVLESSSPPGPAPPTTAPLVLRV